MRKSRFSESQIVGFLKEAQAGRKVREICREHGFTEQTEKMQQYRDAHPGATLREGLFRSQRPELDKYLLGAGVYVRRAID